MFAWPIFNAGVRSKADAENAPLVPADVLAVDEYVFHRGGPFQHQIHAPLPVGFGQGYALAIPAGGIVGQAGLAEDMRNGDLLPLGRLRRLDCLRTGFSIYGKLPVRQGNRLSRRFYG